MALLGGSAILLFSDKRAYYSSLLNFTEKCKEMHVEGAISTHPSLDIGMMRYEMAGNITDGIPNPFVMGEEGYTYYERQFYNLVREFWDK